MQVAISGVSRGGALGAPAPPLPQLAFNAMQAGNSYAVSVHWP